MGPYFFDQPLNCAVFFYVLANLLAISLEDAPLQWWQKMFLQLHGCPAHILRNVREKLDLKYQQWRIGRGNLFYCPPNLQIFPRDDMKIWIREAICSQLRTEIEATVIFTQERLQQCIECDGRQFELLKRHSFFSKSVLFSYYAHTPFVFSFWELTF